MLKCPVICILFLLKVAHVSSPFSEKISSDTNSMILLTYGAFSYKDPDMVDKGEPRWLEL